MGSLYIYNNLVNNQQSNAKPKKKIHVISYYNNSRGDCVPPIPGLELASFRRGLLGREFLHEDSGRSPMVCRCEIESSSSVDSYRGGGSDGK